MGCLSEGHQLFSEILRALSMEKDTEESYVGSQPSRILGPYRPLLLLWIKLWLPAYHAV